MKVLFTGSRGRVGPPLLRFFQPQGWDVVTADFEGATFNGDLRDPEFCNRAVESVSAVIHFAAISHPGPETLANNLESTRLLLQAARSFEIERFVLASTINVRGHHIPPALPIDETQPCHPNDNYASSKLQCEAMLEASCQGSNLKGLSLRLPAIWNDYRTDSHSSVPLDHPFVANNLVDPWHYLDVRDLAQALICYLKLNPAPNYASCYLLASDTTTAVPTAQLLARSTELLELYSTQPEENQALFSNELACRLLEWKPRQSWRQVARGRRLVARIERTFPRLTRPLRANIRAL